jgi:hypothetical protein
MRLKQSAKDGSRAACQKGNHRMQHKRADLIFRSHLSFVAFSAREAPT